MEIDRSIRRLTALENSASTARVLNLLATHRRFPDDLELNRNPFFRNRLLNRSIILKHRLRPNEYVSFGTPRPTVTKILLPIDGTDLRAGAHSFFVGQTGFDNLVEDTFGEDLKTGSRDRQVLDVIDNLPSLDPFLLREHLRASDIEPARAFFAISDADVQRMVEFVREEILTPEFGQSGLKKFGKLPTYLPAWKGLESDPTYRIQLDAVAHGVNAPNYAGYDQLDTYMQQQIGKAVLGTESVNDALKTLHAQIRTVNLTDLSR